MMNETITNKVTKITTNLRQFPVLAILPQYIIVVYNRYHDDKEEKRKGMPTHTVCE